MSGRAQETGESSASIRSRGDDRSWPDVLRILRSGATLVRLPRLRDYFTDNGTGVVGERALSATRVKKLEAAGVLQRVGVDRYGLTEKAQG